MANKVGLPKGMRDFNPEVLRKRNYIINTIKSVFESYGFMPIETPVMEKLEILGGKGGDESDKLMFKVLNSGDYLSKADQEQLIQKDYKKLINSISEKGLRYDLTIPLARYVVQHQNEITFPFKRYQIQPVWRADRPQKGRYREFWQCDADILGSESLINEIHLIDIYAKVFKLLNIPAKIKFSSRKLLQAMVANLNKPEALTDFVVSLDKLDKIGTEKVNIELESKGFGENAKQLIHTLEEISSKENSFLHCDLKTALQQLKSGASAINEIEYIFNNSNTKNLIVDPTLARGLDYYTGPIFEVVSPDYKGSIGGGGRYDDLTGQFGLSGIKGVGISFGLDRIYDLMEENNLFKNINNYTTKVLFVNFDEENALKVNELANKTRNNGITTEFYADPVKIKKQMKYANDKNIPFIVLVGSTELESGKLTLKNMESGEQSELSIEEIIERLK